MAQIDKAHNRPKDTARRNFNHNRKQFAEGIDYFGCKTSEAMKLGILAPRGVTLLTKSGYLMLVKSLTDDLSWHVQRDMVTTRWLAEGFNTYLAFIGPKR